jgi:hypothetical protein
MMKMRVEIAIQDLEALIAQWEARGPSPDEPLLSEICEALGSILGVTSGEVALLEITPDRSSLKFVLPAKLRQVGPVPLEAEGGVPLSARTVLQGQPSIVNDFVSQPHARVFEGVPLGPGATGPIQKIMSTPVFAGGLVIGVAQVSRKGPSAAAAGPDFTPQDLRQLQQVDTLLARIITAGGTVPPKKELTEAELNRIPPNRQRRASRVTIAIPVEVIRQGPKNEIMVEETQTLNVSAYGASIVLKVPPQVGQTVVLIQVQSREEALCRVRSTRPIPKTTNHEVGVAFEQPSPVFWHITFPPEDWDSSVRERASTPRNR